MSLTAGQRIGRQWSENPLFESAVITLWPELRLFLMLIFLGGAFLESSIMPQDIIREFPRSS